ncbi:SDR family NAD(P)-dependent oxidoreductase [Kocuria sp. CPCC 205263]|uniref:SDR family NAD(P)-dependent oxidoreductase n=1 Tax=Kocuria sp. CPCC 205263 TaxID=3073555 RepID=UPI0034D650BD
MSEFTGKAGLVSGAAGGIGRATAIAFGREGASVVVADIGPMRAQAEETVRLVEEAGGKAVFVPVDVADAASVRNLIATTVETYGRLDFAHNNAGVLVGGFLADTTEEDFDKIIAVDLKGVFLAMKEEINHMMEHGGGAIINTASEAGLVGTPQAGAYVAAKHGVVGLTKTAAGEYANFGIRVNGIAPGAIGTPMVLNLPQEAQESLMAPQPMHRLADPSEVAHTVVFLASEKASFITGTIISIDGGATSNAQSYDPVNSPAA